MTLVADAPTPLQIGKRRNNDKTVEKKVPEQAKPAKQPFDPDRFLFQAKAIVVQNYNEHRRKEQVELNMDRVYIVWFAKVLGNWKAIVASPLARGLLWEVSYNGHKNEIYLDYYKKITNVVVPLGEPE